MTTYYVGSGGSDSNGGESWADRLLTLNAAEDQPVVAGDTVYIGPGTYREELIMDVSGSGGSPITYIGDVTGEYTDGVGGIVRITGSNDDKTSTRARGIDAAGAGPRDYRTFRGFSFDLHSTANISLPNQGFDNFIIEDCYFGTGTGAAEGLGTYGDIDSAAIGDALIVRRCLFTSNRKGIDLRASSDKSIDGLFENCIFFQPGDAGIFCQRIYGWTAKNCTFFGAGTPAASSGLASVDAFFTLGSNVSYVYNCLFYARRIHAANAGAIVEDYGLYQLNDSEANFWSNVTKGANTDGIKVMIKPPFFTKGYLSQLANFEFSSEWSDVSSYACGQSPPSTDFYGLDRPSSDSKKTRGAIQYMPILRETTIVPSGEDESIKLPDFSIQQVHLPISGKRMSIKVEVYREANYAGTNPQMIIRQPGQSPLTETDAAAASQWNTLSRSFTPATSPGYILLEIRSNNTASAGSYATYFGALRVK